MTQAPRFVFVGSGMYQQRDSGEWVRVADHEAEIAARDARIASLEARLAEGLRHIDLLAADVTKLVERNRAAHLYELCEAVLAASEKGGAE